MPVQYRGSNPRRGTKRELPFGWLSFGAADFCGAKIRAANSGRLIKRARETRQRFPLHTFLSLQYAEGMRTTKTVGNHRKERRRSASFFSAVLPAGSRGLFSLLAKSTQGYSLYRQLQQGLFIVRRSVQHGVQQILQRIADLSPPQPQRHQVAALHRQVLQ